MSITGFYEEKLKKIKAIAEEGVSRADHEVTWPTGEVMTGAENALREILEELAQ